MKTKLRPHVLIPLFPGTNCHYELAHAFQVSGGNPKIVPIQRLLDGRSRLTDCDLLAVAGGFSYGDHLGSGRVAAFDLTQRLGDQLRELRQRQVPMIGICNGCQILVAAGLLPGVGNIGRTTMVLDHNRRGVYEHWRTTPVCFGPGSIWTEGLTGERLLMTVGHGEGRFRWTSGPPQVVATYGTSRGVISYPNSPNGSWVAAITSTDGRILAMMPHPERPGPNEGKSPLRLVLFESGVRAAR